MFESIIDTQHTTIIGRGHVHPSFRVGIIVVIVVIDNSAIQIS